MNKKILHLSLLFSVLIWLVSACSFVPGLYAPTPEPTPTISELIAQLSSPDSIERGNAADRSGAYYDHPDKAVLVPYLAKSLSDPDDSVRTTAASSIRRLGVYDQDAVKTLISWLDEKGHSDEEMLQGIQALETFAAHAQDATPGLIYVMTTPRPVSPYYRQIRQAAARALAAIGNPAAIPSLLSIVLSTDELAWVRKSAAVALADFGPAANCTVPALVPLLKSPDLDVRASAAIVISQATGDKFPDSERSNWAPYDGVWEFSRDMSGEYLIVIAAKEWWEKTGQHKNWPQCN